MTWDGTAVPQGDVERALGSKRAGCGQVTLPGVTRCPQEAGSSARKTPYLTSWDTCLRRMLGQAGWLGHVCVYVCAWSVHLSLSGSVCMSFCVLRSPVRAFVHTCTWICIHVWPWVCICTDMHTQSHVHILYVCVFTCSLCVNLCAHTYLPMAMNLHMHFVLHI